MPGQREPFVDVDVVLAGADLEQAPTGEVIVAQRDIVGAAGDLRPARAAVGDPVVLGRHVVGLAPVPPDIEAVFAAVADKLTSEDQVPAALVDDPRGLLDFLLGHLFYAKEIKSRSIDNSGEKADLIVVLTGGSVRIAEGLILLEDLGRVIG